MSTLPTPVCALLGIEQPIVLAPMVAVPALAAAVSNSRRARHADADVVGRCRGCGP